MVVTAPVVAGDREVVPPGTRLRGVVMLAREAENDDLRAQMILHFPVLIEPKGGTKMPTSLVAVDNARETVQMGRILGIPHPKANRIFWGIKTAASASNPFAGYALQAASFTFNREYKRGIIYGKGTDLTLRVTGPVQLQQTAAHNSWPLLPPAYKSDRIDQCPGVADRNQGQDAQRPHQRHVPRVRRKGLKLRLRVRAGPRPTNGDHGGRKGFSGPHRGQRVFPGAGFNVVAEW